MAHNGDSKTIIDSARETLKDLFKRQTETKPLPGQWCTLTPKNETFLDCAPSQSSTYYLQEEGCEDNVKEYLQKSFDKIFTATGNVETFWESFTMELNHKLGLTYRKVKKMDGKLYNEAKLKHDILHPILKEVSKAACIIPFLESESIKTHYIIEDELEIKYGKSGQKPSVDGTIQVTQSDKGGKILAVIPVEMKVDMEIKDYSQIACYMNKLSAVEDVRKITMVGVLIDKMKFRLAFSVFHNQDVPLPVVHISPPIEWKSESLILEQAMLILTCTILVGRLNRIKYPSHRASPTFLEEMGKKLLDRSRELPSPQMERLGLLPLKRRIDEQNELIQGLYKTIDEQDKRIKKLESTPGIKS